MTTKKIRIGSSVCTLYLEASFAHLANLVPVKKAVLLVDEMVLQQHAAKFKKYTVIAVASGEASKQLPYVLGIYEKLITLGVDRSFTLVGVGGGVVTDIAGFVASTFLRGIAVGFVPTTILAMVDACLGGKNGVDVGVAKNMVGVIRQPSFILYDLALLKTLPQKEWSNGFAEIIKHACIGNRSWFPILQDNTVITFQKKKKLLADLIQKNALYKLKVVQQDELEQGDRKLLNFGHTLAHAIENTYTLSHGDAVAIGIHFACFVAHEQLGFTQTAQVLGLLRQYQLPVFHAMQVPQAMQIMKSDKKKLASDVQYVLLQKLGKGVVQKLSLDSIENYLNTWVHANS